MSDTICAISTPLGRGAISIVRMSGKHSLEIMKEIFYCKSLDYQNIKPRYLYYGYLKLENGCQENCLAVYFKSPFSYTGEDLVEFQIHGGTLLTKSVLDLLLNHGARIAENGEFTKRAFENGKISLDVAESIIDEINAESESELRASLSLSNGRLSKKVNDLQNNLTECLAKIEATLDYPEEDFEDETKISIFNNIKQIKNDLIVLQEDSKYSKIITNGINVAIVGAPNVGKSSTLNALIGDNRAIVTDIEGTTRDVLSESIFYNGIKINFIDTAGIRKSEDKVEKIGIEKSISYIDKADVILFIIDGSRPFNDYDKNIEILLKDHKNVLRIINKSDLDCKVKPNKDDIIISALNEKNINDIKERIYSLTISEKINYDHAIITSTRQIEIINDAIKICDQILSNKSESMDIIAFFIKNLWNTLGKITGKSENENIIDMIFSKFCLGK